MAQILPIRFQEHIQVRLKRSCQCNENAWLSNEWVHPPKRPHSIACQHVRCFCRVLSPPDRVNWPLKCCEFITCMTFTAMLYSCLLKPGKTVNRTLFTGISANPGELSLRTEEHVFESIQFFLANLRLWFHGNCLDGFSLIHTTVTTGSACQETQTHTGYVVSCVWIYAAVMNWRLNLGYGPGNLECIICGTLITKD
jgi:hypothetical protein